MLIAMPPKPPAVTTGYGELGFEIWLRGTEVRVRGYIEPADREVGIMSPSLVIEDFVPVVPDPHWRCPDIEALSESSEYADISRAFWETYHKWGDYEWYVYWQEEYEIGETELFLKHADWLNYWLG